MGRGLSKQQKQILGLAVAVADHHGLPVDRGVYGDPDYYTKFDRWRKQVICLDVTWALAVHVVAGIPISDKLTVRKDSPRYYYPKYEQSNPGYFDGNAQGVKVAKASTARALTRLQDRDLIEYARATEQCPYGYVLTNDGRHIAEDHALELDDADFLINRFALARYRSSWNVRHDNDVPWYEHLEQQEREAFDAYRLTASQNAPPVTDTAEQAA